MTLKEALVLGLGGAGLLWYYLCLFSVGLKPTKRGQQPSGFRQFESLSITTISVSLATFVGSLLGLKQRVDQVAAAAPSGASSGSASILQFIPRLSIANLQWASAGLYVMSLLIAIAFWYRERDDTDPAISNLGKSLLGLVGGALAIVLGAP